MIVLLDQFARHIHRFTKMRLDSVERLQCDEKALNLSKMMHSTTSIFDEDISLKNQFLSLPVAQFIFSLMPFRHTATIPNLHRVLESLKEKETVSIHLSTGASFTKVLN